MAKNPLTRAYKLGDPRLKQKSDDIKLIVNRDMADFNTRGITNTLVLEGLITTFDSIQDDSYYLGLVSIKRQERDEAMDALDTDLKIIRTAALNKWGEEDARYCIYRFNTLDEAKRNPTKMIQLSRNIHTIAVGQAADLGGGITAAFLAGVLTKRNELDNKTNEMQQSENIRDLATQDRLKAGNALYKEIVNLCNTGKDLYAKTDEARYNDYVLYNNPSGGEDEAPAPPAPPEGTATLHGLVRDNGNGSSIKAASIVLMQNGIAKYTAVSNAYGGYSLTGIAPGMYTINYSAAGFDDYTVDDVIFEAGDTLDEDGLLMRSA
jgi:hypothetical protein